MHVADEYLSDFESELASEPIHVVCEKVIKLICDGSVDQETVALVIRRFISLSVKLRDEGNVADALHAMYRLWSVKRDRDLCLEILVIIVLIQASANEFRSFKEGVGPEFQRDKHIALLMAGGYFSIDDLNSCVDSLRHVSPEDVAYIPSFAKFRSQLVLDLFEALIEITEKIGLISDSPKIASLARAMASQGVANRLQSVRDVNSFEQLLLSLVFRGDLSNRVPGDLMCSAILGLSAESQTDERAAVMLRYLVAWRDAEKAQQLAQSLIGTEVQEAPDYLKALFRLSELPAMQRWRQPAIDYSRQLSDASGEGKVLQLEKASIQARELKARLLKIDGSAEKEFLRNKTLPATAWRGGNCEQPHLFVGFFGQIRFPGHVIPSLSRHVREQVQPLIEKGWTISYGASVWNKVGQRAIFDHDAVHFIQERLPLEISNEVSKLPISTVGELKRILPETVEFCASMDAVGNVTSEYLKKMFSMDLYSAIGDDECFMRDVGKRISDSFGGDQNVVNQARMWNRLGRLKELVLKAAQEANKQVTNCLLIRTDLLFHDSQLWPNVLSKATEARKNFVIADHDPHANFIEGLGDRILFCDMPAFNRIADGEELMQFVVNNEPTHAPYKARFHAHTFLETILFENDTHISRVPWLDLKHEIYRGRTKLNEVQSQLQRDLGGKHPDLRRFNRLIQL